MHILAKNASRCQEHHLIRIYNIFKKRGIDLFVKDKEDCTALHNAVESDTYHLVRLLLIEGLPVNAGNSKGHTPLSLYLSKRSGLTHDCMPLLAANASVF